ncbi:hypothetical protein F5Y18DRAFT_17056 [Xylariaceae sp. FL1019]|nr:hypothetical protein F5Y18DRAFT_17056 [Xylariaceae sp. FL1019]
MWSTRQCLRGATSRYGTACPGLISWPPQLIPSVRAAFRLTSTTSASVAEQAVNCAAGPFRRWLFVRRARSMLHAGRVVSCFCCFVGPLGHARRTPLERYDYSIYYLHRLRSPSQQSASAFSLTPSYFDSSSPGSQHMSDNYRETIISIGSVIVLVCNESRGVHAGKLRFSE